MKGLIASGLSVLLLSVAAPAFALADRFDDARRENLNKGLSAPVGLIERFDDARRENLDQGVAEVSFNRLDDAFSPSQWKQSIFSIVEVSFNRLDDARRENLDKGLTKVNSADRLDDARRENLNKGVSRI